MAGRVYVRKFDRDEARRRVQAGETRKAVAASLGVSVRAVRYATDPRAYAQMLSQKAEYQSSGVCVECAARCSHNPSRPPDRCRACAAEHRRTTVRPSTLLCMTCKRWKRDSAFPHSRDRRLEHRRGRHRQCTTCQTIARTAYRARNKVPCKNCGRPRTPPGELCYKSRDTGLCLECYRSRASRS